MFYAINNKGQKKSREKISPMKAGGKKGKNFLQVKISSYMVYQEYSCYYLLQSFILL